ncbi:MAG TPA: hypothetical protein DEF42_12965 [Desulfosporosinus sp.]|nr:hypothetical protein [Desulfosporosinus sp.]
MNKLFKILGVTALVIIAIYAGINYYSYQSFNGTLTSIEVKDIKLKSENPDKNGRVELTTLINGKGNYFITDSYIIDKETWETRGNESESAFAKKRGVEVFDLYALSGRSMRDNQQEIIASTQLDPRIYGKNPKPDVIAGDYYVVATAKSRNTVVSNVFTITEEMVAELMNGEKVLAQKDEEERDQRAAEEKKKQEEVARKNAEAQAASDAFEKNRIKVVSKMDNMWVYSAYVEAGRTLRIQGSAEDVLGIIIKSESGQTIYQNVVKGSYDETLTPSSKYNGTYTVQFTFIRTKQYSWDIDVL